MFLQSMFHKKFSLTQTTFLPIVHYYGIEIYSDTAFLISAASESGNLMYPANAK